ncbi:hypothetical protein D3C81_1667960 [compost metagenome]
MVVKAGLTEMMRLALFVTSTPSRILSRMTKARRKADSRACSSPRSVTSMRAVALSASKLASMRTMPPMPPASPSNSCASSTWRAPLVKTASRKRRKLPCAWGATNCSKRRPSSWFLSRCSKPQAATLTRVTTPSGASEK